jgi:hypothetical protein
MKAKKKNKVLTKTKIPNKTLSSVKKSLGELMKDEDGFVSKETILKVGLSTVAALGIAGGVADVSAADHTNHVNNVGSSGQQINHGNVTTHSSY